MKHVLSQTLATLAVLAAPLALAAAPAKLCEDHLTQDRQPDFSAASLELQNSTLDVTSESPPRLQLNTNRTALDPERIFFPFDQRVTISYVYEEAAAAHVLGYMYVDDVKARGYLNAAGELTDSNANGIFDLHEDIFNVSPPSGPKARPYIGLSRRCNRTFTSGGETYSQPDLVSRGSCASNFSPQTDMADARPGQTSTLIKVDRVGDHLSWSNAATNDFSDRGLFDRIPNLLEPPADANDNEGLGKIVFLLSDDDGHQSTYGNLAPVKDQDESSDGIPDYDVSNYDSRGLVRASNPDPGITTYDRTVDLGQVRGGKEIVFFLIVYFDSPHGPNEGSSNACLKQDANGKCLLHMRSSISVFFTKAAWNLDQNFLNGIVSERNIGCSYDTTCYNPSSPLACNVGNTSTKLCGWLDGPKTQPGTALYRLANDAAYGNLDMPMERVTVPRPPGVRNPMPHVIVGAPTTDPFRWILGFEDTSGGGDRDFNDVVFVVNKQNGGNTRSATVSGDISPSVADDFVITKVRFKRQDDTAPAPRTCPGGAPCWSEETPGACTPADGLRPSIRYSLAVDCRICANGTCTNNPDPTWFPVEFPNTSPPTQQVELDLLALGFTGSQLCWKVDVSSPNDRCRPVIDNIDVGYQAVRAGSYARASPSTLGNAIVWGVNETPGSAWGRDWPASGLPAPSVRAYDGRKDYSLRGRLYFRSLYDPELPTATNVVDRWDAGRVMSLALGGGKDPLTRKLYTMDTTGARTTVTAEMEDGDSASPLFPDSLCDMFQDDRYLYDLNNDGKCGTPSSLSPDKRVTGVTNDRNFLREWLYGWEDHYAPGASNVKRPWPMGGINLSTVAMVVPPYLDSWAQNARAVERDEYRKNFMEPLAARPTVAMVGTMNGYLHAFDAGAFRHGMKDECAAVPQLRGFFEPTGACTEPVASRQYGSGEEVFAYMPRLMLEHYRNLYVQLPGATDARPQVDASPTVANVDFGISGKPAWTRATSASKTTGAKTVLVSASGKGSPAVFALDITNPGDPWYPLPLWEFNFKNPAIDLAFLAAKTANPQVKYPDNSGSRHAPSVARLNWDANTAGVWTAVVGTDYVPSEPTRAGTVYLIDMKTGQPLNYGTSPGGLLAGIITLDAGSGVAAESALVDLNKDGSYDVIYVPTTAGNVYRINLGQVDTSAPLGRKVKTCKVASAPVAVSVHPDAAQNQDAIHQQIYSNLGLKVLRDNDNPKVRFYFGTSDNPDEYTDGPANKSTYRYHLMGFEDADPTGAQGCTLLEPLWVKPLEPGQTVWGGVALSKDSVFATTAVGRAADICNLSDTETGRLYEAPQQPQPGSELKKATLSSHGINAPVVHDQHLFVLTATGDMQMMGGDTWNNGTADSGAIRSRILVYDPIPDGRLPR
jgi:type IV pilus assembly protein PilY1